jgi:uncharacterized protein YeaO (DUF488 family)
MVIRVVRLGEPRAKGEGLRLGTVRRPPRGVPKSAFASRDFYDVWLPNLSPSAELVASALKAAAEKDAAAWKRFVSGYRKQMAVPEAAHLLELLAAMSKHANFSVGCYCEEEAWCHRSVLRGLLEERGAEVVK